MTPLWRFAMERWHPVNKETILYYFSGPTLRGGLPLPQVGKWFTLPETIKIKACPSSEDIDAGFGGLHASPTAYDALQYAPGNLLHRVILRGDVTPHGSPVDKFAARSRKIIASIDAKELLWEFARWAAFQVIDNWEAPDVVIKYLTSGNLDLKSAANSAANSAAYSAANCAANSAANSAAYSAQRDKLTQLVNLAFGDNL